MYKFYVRCLFVIHFLFKKNCFYVKNFFYLNRFEKCLFFFFRIFYRIFFIFIRIIESIESLDLNHDIKKSDKIFENSLSFNDKISSFFESSLSSNQSDRIYPITAVAS